MESQLKATVVTATNCWPQGVERLLVVEGWTAVHYGVAAGWEKRSVAAVVRVEIKGQELGNLAGGAVQLAGSHKGRHSRGRRKERRERRKEERKGREA